MSQDSTSELPSGNADADTPPQVASNRRVNLTGKQADEITWRQALSLCVNALALLTAAKKEKEANGESERYRQLDERGWEAARTALITGRAEMGA